MRAIIRNYFRHSDFEKSFLFVLVPSIIFRRQINVVGSPPQLDYLVDESVDTVVISDKQEPQTLNRQKAKSL